MAVNVKKLSFFDTEFNKALGLKALADDALPFVIQNYKGIAVDVTGYNQLASIKTLSNTPLSDIFYRVVDLELLRLFCVMDLRNYTDIPEVLTFNDLTIDGNKIERNTLAGLKRVWMNITPILSPKTEGLVVNNISRLFELIGRGTLMMSYDDSDMWLDPRSATFLIESYSTAISGIIQRLYNLDPLEYAFVQTLFSAYYAQIIGPSDGPFDLPPLLNRVKTLGSINDIKNRLDYIGDLRENNGHDILTPIKICDILSKRGSAKLRPLKASNLYRVFAGNAADNQIMQNAMEYPPYWAYQILRVLSGSKNSVATNLFKFGKMKLNAQIFGEEIARSPQFLKAIGR